MSDPIPSIRDIDLDLICDYFAGVERQGPGSPEITRRALGLVAGLEDASRIADIGCGTGGQTMVLARAAPGRITGIDLFPRFIDLFNRNATRLGLQDRVQGLVGSMDQLPFDEVALDLLWSEGAIYNIGFERGLAEWRRFLKPGGTIAVSEASWFTETRPAEIEAYWNSEYPGIDTIPNKLRQLQQAGYYPVAAFTLPETCWLDHFYAPQAQATERFLARHPGNPAAEAFVANQRHEEAVYHKYKAYYGYAFYIGRKIEP